MNGHDTRQNDRLHAWAQVLVLALTGAYFTLNLVSGSITNYIAAKFIWLSWVAAGLLWALAIVRAAELWRGRTRDPHAHHDHGDHGEHTGHVHTHTAGRWAWIGLGIVALPALVGFLVPSEPLGTQAIEGSIPRRLDSIDVSPGSPLSIAPTERSILDWLRAFSLESDAAAFDGQAVDITGFVYREGDDESEPDRFTVARFVVSCCVADAQPVGLVVEAPGADFANDTWVRVRGHFEARTVAGELYPVLVADDGPDGVVRMSQPDHPYLYP